MQLDLSQNISVTQSLEQVLAPQQLQSLEILQATSQELEQRILLELSQNPMLELEAAGLEVAESDLYAEDRRTRDEINEELAAEVIEKDESLAAELLEGGSDNFLDDFLSDYSSPRTSLEEEAKRRFFFDSLSEEPDLFDLLEEQIRELAATDEELKNISLELVSYLDEAGYLRYTAAELSAFLNINQDKILEAIKLLQTLYPPGIAAYDLRECLLLQLQQNNEKDSLAWKIVDRFLDDLSRNRLPQIARNLEVDLNELRDAVDRIKLLSPKPGYILSSKLAPIVSADVFIEKNPKGQWTVRMNDEIVPKIVLNEIYQEKLEEGNLPEEDKRFIREKTNSAKQLLKAIDERQKTIARIAEALLILQKDFFEKGIDKLKPMIMAEIAEILELHEATISRAIANKYLKSPQGFFPFKYFFTSGYSSSQSGKEISSRSIKQQIIKIINEEDPAKPFSDQSISNMLKKEGLKVARRTVAKYREEENIPAASLRRVH